MELIELLNAAPLLRPIGVTRSLRQVYLLSLSKDMGLLEEFLAANPQLQPKALAFPDLSDSRARLARISFPDGREMGAANLGDIGNYPQYEKVFICPSNAGESAAYITEICRFLSGQHIRELYLAANEAPAHTMRQPLPDFFANNSAKLLEAFGLFDTEESRLVFAARLKALLTGNSGYLPVASHPDYFHPQVAPAAGDIMIDGGVSDLVGAQKSFIDAVGITGRIYGFEPIPRLWRTASAKLGQSGNYQLECAGLAEKPGKAFFEDLSDSSHLAVNGGSNTVECALESIDSFCAKNQIKRVDCIKLDIEGAELGALKGAVRTIKEHRPKLIICLYHKPQDMFEIPVYIKSLFPHYKLYLSHTSCQFMDTVLYAAPDK